MTIKNILFTFLCTLSSFSVFCQTAFVTSNNGYPWGSNTYATCMNNVFGVGSWDDLDFETVSPTVLFSASYTQIYLEGGDFNASELATFISTNQVLIENWVTNGGQLFINSAPNEGSNINIGFGGIMINYSGNSSFADCVVDAPNIASNCLITDSPTNVTGNFPICGTSYAHAYITGTNIEPILLNDATLNPVLAEISFGAGSVLIGGITSTNFHSPPTEAKLLYENILTNFSCSFCGPTYTVQTTCNLGDDNNFFVDIIVSDAGTDPMGYTISGAATSIINAVGTYSFGPFPNGTENFTITGVTETDCIKNISAVGDCTCQDDDMDGFSECEGDCDDNDPLVVPGGVEICGDGIDNNCDGIIDFIDVDGDTFNFCNGEDCDDTNAGIFPGASELCDGLDNDCDGIADPGIIVDAANPYIDTFDNAPIGSTSCGATSPDPNTTWTNNSPTGLTWTVDGNGTPSGSTGPIDDVTGGGFYIYAETSNPCNGGNDVYILESCPFDLTAITSCSNLSFWYHAFGSGIGDFNFEYSIDGGTTWISIFNITSQVQNSSADPFIEFSTGIVGTPMITASTRFRFHYVSGNSFTGDFAFDQFSITGSNLDNVDNDMDGFSECDGDCDDSDPLIVPGGVEICGDGIDNNCDGIIDFIDVDGDTFNFCNGEDCDDTNAGIFPGASELCDGLDNDCDGIADPGIIVDAANPYIDTFDNAPIGSTSCGVTSSDPNTTWTNNSPTGLTWTVDGNGTPSSSTGPIDDVTGGGLYIYAETSGSCNGGNDVYILESCPFDLSSLTGCTNLSFWYHAFGSGIGDFNFEYSIDGGTTWISVFNINTQIQNFNSSPFIEQVIPVSGTPMETANTRFRFNYVSGSNFRGDFAFDQFSITTNLGAIPSSSITIVQGGNTTLDAALTDATCSFVAWVTDPNDIAGTTISTDLTGTIVNPSETTTYFAVSDCDGVECINELVVTVTDSCSDNGTLIRID